LHESTKYRWEWPHKKKVETWFIQNILTTCQTENSHLRQSHAVSQSQSLCALVVNTTHSWHWIFRIRKPNHNGAKTTILSKWMTQNSIANSEYTNSHHHIIQYWWACTCLGGGGVCRLLVLALPTCSWFIVGDCATIVGADARVVDINGAVTPSIVILPSDNDCRNKGKLFWKDKILIMFLPIIIAQTPHPEQLKYIYQQFLSYLVLDTTYCRIGSTPSSPRLE
jgi:hypothetical protein